MNTRKVYTTDVTEKEWQRLAPLVPAPKPGGCPITDPRREIVNAIFYLLRTGWSWRLLPPDFPPWRSVFYYFWPWRKAGIWERIPDTLRGDLRQAEGRQRHLLVDTLGVVLAVVVHAAHIQARDEAQLVLERLKPKFSRLRLI